MIELILLGVTADGGYDLAEAAGTPGPAGEYQQRYYAPPTAVAYGPGARPRPVLEAWAADSLIVMKATDLTPVA